MAKTERMYSKTGKTVGNLRLEAAKKAAANAKAEKIVVKSPASQAEAEFAKMVNAGKVTPQNITQVKEKISRKWGIWPNGKTN